MFTSHKSLVTRSSIAGLAAIALAFGAAATVHAWYPYTQQTATPSMYYNPYTGQLHVHVDRQVVASSAYDPCRSVVDPGSARRVDRYVYNNYGQLVHEEGYEWTSFGVPHSQLTQHVVQPTGIATTGYYGYPQPAVVSSTTTTYQRSATASNATQPSPRATRYSTGNSPKTRNGTSVTRGFAVPRK